MEWFKALFRPLDKRRAAEDSPSQIAEKSAASDSLHPVHAFFVTHGNKGDFDAVREQLNFAVTAIRAIGRKPLLIWEDAGPPPEQEQILLSRRVSIEAVFSQTDFDEQRKGLNKELAKMESGVTPSIDVDGFMLELSRYLIHERVQTVAEAGSCSSWQDSCVTDVIVPEMRQCINNGDTERLLVLQGQAMGSTVRSGLARDLSLADQIQNILRTRDGVSILVVRGFGHRMPLERRLREMRVNFRSFCGEREAQDALPMDRVVTSRNNAGNADPRLSREEKDLLILDPIATMIYRIVGETIERYWNEQHRDMQCSTRAMKRFANAICDRWTPQDIQSFYVPTRQPKSIYVRGWLSARTTATERAFLDLQAAKPLA